MREHRLADAAEDDAFMSSLGRKRRCVRYEWDDPTEIQVVVDEEAVAGYVKDAEARIRRDDLRAKGQAPPVTRPPRPLPPPRPPSVEDILQRPQNRTWAEWIWWARALDGWSDDRTVGEVRAAVYTMLGIDPDDRHCR